MPGVSGDGADRKAKKADTSSAKNSKKASSKKKAVTNEQRTSQIADPFAPQAVQAPKTGTFLDDLPIEAERRTDTIATPAILNAADARSMTYVIYEARAEQPALFQTFGGTPTHEETDVLPFAGKRRYLLRNPKIRGVVRRVLQDHANAGECSYNEPCQECNVCLTFGYRGQSDTGRSPVVFYDFWSIEEQDPHVENARSVRGNPFLRQAQVVPVGTRFIGAFSLRNPTRSQLADILQGVEYALTAGVGARTTTHGSMTVRPIATMGGIWKNFASVWPILERIDAGVSVDDAVAAHLGKISYNGRLPHVTGEKAAEALEVISRLSTMHPLYDRYDLEEAA